MEISARPYTSLSTGLPDLATLLALSLVFGIFQWSCCILFCLLSSELDYSFAFYCSLNLLMFKSSLITCKDMPYGSEAVCLLLRFVCFYSFSCLNVIPSDAQDLCLLSNDMSWFVCWDTGSLWFLQLEWSFLCSWLIYLLWLAVAEHWVYEDLQCSSSFYT